MIGPEQRRSAAIFHLVSPAREECSAGPAPGPRPGPPPGSPPGPPQAPDPCAPPEPVASPESPDPTAAAPPALELLARFRHSCETILGRGSAPLLAGAERAVRAAHPLFALADAGEETAEGAFDFILIAVTRAPWLRRAALRKNALLILADFYNRRYDELRAAGMLGRVEESYYRLRR